ncbi:hypothetical protein [Paludisphaera mucosa]|uniref:CBM6 domain-containing protein n=1 Tax=Paludisphaera mucosa TaxID=3030827 RepID=A0ABT6FFA6_9BACT|nr:hypothetical protein [Paludisphaera mucosa]MDG3006262.1 hypothetical protein [Paludisphaera mucosa]
MSGVMVLVAALGIGGFPGEVAGPKHGPPGVTAPGSPMTPSLDPAKDGGPAVFENGGEAGPDETFLIVGEGLTKDLSVWGPSADEPLGRAWTPKVQFLKDGLLAATLPESAPDGVFVAQVKGPSGASSPVVLNAPQPWWCAPDDRVAPGSTVRVFGRNLARRPDFVRAFVYLKPAGGTLGNWAAIASAGKYEVQFVVPAATEPGRYEVWLHAGSGGEYGWGGPLVIEIAPPPAAPAKVIDVAPGHPLQEAVDATAAAGGGTVRLAAGYYDIATTLRIPTNVTVAGAGRDRTVVQIVRDPTARFPRLAGAGWDQAPGAIHTVGDRIEYTVDVPTAGKWSLWARYATDMAPWNQPGVTGNHTMAVADGPGVPLVDMDNTGGFGKFRWTKAAALDLPAGRSKLTWANVKGGGVSLDAFALAADPAYVPPAPPAPFPASGPGLVVWQGEDCDAFRTTSGTLPGGDRAIAWLQGDHAALLDLTLLGDARTSLGAAIRSPDPLTWLDGVRIERVRVADLDGKQGENCAVHVRKAERATVRGCVLQGRAPLFLSGVRRCTIADNRLVSVTRFGGNAEAAILARTETVDRCLIEGNVVASPVGAEAGGATARRLIWLSTGHGSVTNNWIARNGPAPPAVASADRVAGPPRFSGVAGTDQNVGEMILFEGNHRTAYFGPIATGDPSGVTLPETVPDTPDDRLGKVKREQLAHDAQGRETPFQPPAADDGGEEPPLGEYFVTVMSGRGCGQTRRVVGREGRRLTLDRPWAVAPGAGSVVAVGVMFHRNLIVGNATPDGMTGVQLWISCVENVVAGNSIHRQRKAGVFIYATATNLASSMPRTWNEGIAPTSWNVAEGNLADECSPGLLVISGESGRLPVDFPRALGNVVRRNSLIRSRTDGVILQGRGPTEGVVDAAAGVAGTIVEFNVVRDARVGYHAGAGADGVVFRRNHAYFWGPVDADPGPATAFQVDRRDAATAIELNSVEGPNGTPDGKTIELKTPEGDRKLPE